MYGAVVTKAKRFAGKHLYTLSNGENEIHALAFSPNRYWLCAACGPTIKIWDLEGKALLDELRPELINLNSKAGQPECLSLAWSPDGQVRIWGKYPFVATCVFQ